MMWGMEVEWEDTGQKIQIFINGMIISRDLFFRMITMAYYKCIAYLKIAKRR
jgi:hypothetical protein